MMHGDFYLLVAFIRLMVIYFIIHFLTLKKNNKIFAHLQLEGAKALAKLENIACQNLLFVSVSLVKNNNVMADLGLTQYPFQK